MKIGLKVRVKSTFATGPRFMGAGEAGEVVGRDQNNGLVLVKAEKDDLVFGVQANRLQYWSDYQQKWVG